MSDEMTPISALLAELQAQFQAPARLRPEPEDVRVATLLALPPTRVLQARATLAFAEARKVPEGTERRAALNRDVDDWSYRIRLGQYRDAAIARQQARGGSYSSCTCLGQGGTGERVAMFTGPSGIAQVVTDEQDEQVMTWAAVCPCPDGQDHARLVETAREQAAERARARRVARIAGAAEIPRRYQTMTIDSWYDRAVQRLSFLGDDVVKADRVKEQLAQWERLTSQQEPNPRCLLVLAGNNGTGKTGLASVLAQRWVAVERSVLFRASAQIVDDLRAAPYRPEDGNDMPTERALLLVYQTCDLLVMDDLGTEAVTGADGERVRERLFRILESRLNECKATIVTTNLSRAGVIERLGERIADRLQDHTFAVGSILTTPNLRAKQAD